MAPASLSLLTIRAADIDRSARFYAALGLQFIGHRHGTSDFHHSAECGGLVFEIHPLRPDDAPTRSTRLGFRVADVAAVVQRLVAAGGTLVAPPTASEWGERAIVADPDDHRIELLAAKR